MENKDKVSEYHIIQATDREPIYRQLSQLEETLALDPHKVKRLTLGIDQWLPENLKFVEKILTRYSFDVVVFQRMDDGPDLESLGKTPRLELSRTPLRPFMPAMLASNSLLELSISSTLSDIDIDLFVTFLSSSFCQVHTLDLMGSRFLDDSVVALADGFQNHVGSLKTICLSECNLVDAQIGSLVHGLFECCSQNPESFDLEELDISFNKGGFLTTSTLSALLQISRLQKLRMGFQAFGEGKQIDLSGIFEIIANNQYLTELEIGGNSLRDVDMPSLVHGLMKNH